MEKIEILNIPYEKDKRLEDIHVGPTAETKGEKDEQNRNSYQASVEKH